MRRAVTLITLLALIALTVGLAGCGGGEEVSPTPETVVGTIPGATTAERGGPTSTLEGDASNGEKVFASAGCGGCHTLEAAGSSGNVGPNLDDSKPDRGLAVDRVTNGAGRDARVQGPARAIRRSPTSPQYVVESTQG